MAKKIKVSGYESFIAEIKKKELTTVIPNVSDYHQLKVELGILPQSLLGVTQVVDKSNYEYLDGWDGIRSLLSVLWRKFMGDKFKSQELANFVFTLLLQGIESGWKAVTEAIRRKMGAEAVSDVSSIVESINQLTVGGKGEELINDIKQIKEAFKTPTADKKPPFWERFLRVVEAVLSVFTKKVVVEVDEKEK